MAKVMIEPLIKAIDKLERSPFGCGAKDCYSCYPIQYSCEWCFTDFDNPISLNEKYVCPECDWVNNDFC